MKKIGILGGMAPESTAEYYRILISLTKERGWGKRYPVIIVYSLNFEKFYKLLSNGKNAEVVSLLSDGINSLEKAGADFALMASNTPHMFFDEVEKNSSIPLLSIVEATAKEAKNGNYKKIGLLGTNFTMEGEFYEDVFKERDIELVVPPKDERDFIDRVIFSELTSGKYQEKTKNRLIRITEKMIRKKEIEAAALACTELPLILNRNDLEIPVLNTTKIHAKAALEYAMED